MVIVGIRGSSIDVGRIIDVQRTFKPRRNGRLSVICKLVAHVFRLCMTLKFDEDIPGLSNHQKVIIPIIKFRGKYYGVVGGE